MATKVSDGRFRLGSFDSPIWTLNQSKNVNKIKPFFDITFLAHHLHNVLHCAKHFVTFYVHLN